MKRILLALLGASAITAFLGMNLLSPLFARPVAQQSQFEQPGACGALPAQ